MRLTPISTAATPETQRDALAAPVHDPLWLLARQWQTRGFLADDAGSPVRVQLSSVTAPLRAGGPAGEPMAAVEPWVEAEPRPQIDDLDHRALVALASELCRRLRDAAAPVRAAWTAAFPFTPSAPAPTIVPFVGRIPDPRPLYHLLAPALGSDGQGGSMPALPGVDPAHAAGVERACRGWIAWLADRLAPAGQDAGNAPGAWDPQRLEYRFRLGAVLPDAAVALPADEYDGSGVEWYTFDRSALVPGAGSGEHPQSLEVRPAPVTYPGMPRPRFWELEDGDVNLDALAATDPAHAVLTSFAHLYANDWFLVPLSVAPGVSTITSLDVTDTFGSTTAVLAVAAVDGGKGPWRLWELTSADPDPAPGAGMRLLVPPTPRPLAGEVLEDVLVVRDELANLAWMVERLTRDASGEPVDRIQRHLQLRPPGDPAFDPGDRPEERQQYRLGTTVPDNWYPLLSSADAGGRPLLTLAALPPGAVGVSDDGVQGTLVPHLPGTSIADEEVPREGAHITRQDRLLPGGDGVVVWRSRTKSPGLGEASSGLRFDVLE
ncbi:MAG TPA: hypothetical protein VMW35_21530 [Myxococcota bacterium]|nr:hypothetical protein [Myxococcota bacterium]